MQGDTQDTFLAGRVELLLRAFKKYQLYTQSKCLEYLGAKFSAVLRNDETLQDHQVGELLLRKMVLVHLTSNTEKFHMLLFMAKKLYALVAGKCTADNPDSPMHHELLLSGHLYCVFLKVRACVYKCTALTCARARFAVRKNWTRC